MSNAITGYLLVFLGGGLGTMLRHSVNLLATRLAWTEFPYGTMIINVNGKFQIA